MYQSTYDFALQLWKDNKLDRQIFTMTSKLPVRTLDNWIKKWKSGVYNRHRGRNGRPSSIPKAFNKSIGLMISRNKYTNAKDITKKLMEWNVHVSQRTVQRRLNEMGYKCKLTKRVPMMSEKQRLARLEWAKVHGRKR